MEASSHDLNNIDYFIIVSYIYLAIFLMTILSLQKF